MDAAHICLCDIAAEYFGESRHHFTAWKTLPSYLFLEKMCIVSLLSETRPGKTKVVSPF